MKAAALVCFSRLHCGMRALIFSFFVLSGFLICALLTRQPSLNAAAIVEFYFRRLKRLLLVFLVFLNATIFGAAIFALPDDYAFVLREVAPAAFFYSNLPRTHALSYFDEVRLQHKMFCVVRFTVKKHFSSIAILRNRETLYFCILGVCPWKCNSMRSRRFQLQSPCAASAAAAAGRAAALRFLARSPHFRSALKRWRTAPTLSTCCSHHDCGSFSSALSHFMRAPSSRPLSKRRRVWRQPSTFSG